MSGQRPVVLFDPISDSVQSALHTRCAIPSHYMVSWAYWQVERILPCQDSHHLQRDLELEWEGEHRAAGIKYVRADS